MSDNLNLPLLSRKPETWPNLHFPRKCLSINVNYKKNINWVTDFDCLVDLKNNSFMTEMVQHFSVSKDHEIFGSDLN